MSKNSSKKGRFNARGLMELAIKSMHKSIQERRDDGKACPKVGAVLWKPNGEVETSYRGELRYGDHAEFTLLERKNRSNKLDGSILFSTLEPCAPDSRHPPKMGCAERIVLARIEEVWIGIEDPDPTVERKGIKFLQDAGIKVHMFDRDLQEVIKNENKEFIAQAMERAMATKEKPKEIILSELENAFPDTLFDDLSRSALNEYRTRANIKETIGSSEFKRLLLRQGLLKEEQGILTPTGFGFLLFGKKPRRVMYNAGLLALICYPNGEEERKEFDQPLIQIPVLVERWLKDKLPNVIDREHMQREEVPTLPFMQTREGVVNALIHRDYSISGAKCQLTVTKDTVTIRSPGYPPSPITVEQLQEFTAPMLSRNPSLHYIFGQMKLAEEQGFGIRSMRTEAEKLGLPLPRYAWDNPYLVLTLFRNQEAAVSVLSQEMYKMLTKSEQKGWQWIATKGKATSSQYAKAINVESRTARRHLNHFVELRMVKKTGSGPSTEYEVL